MTEYIIHACTVEDCKTGVGKRCLICGSLFVVWPQHYHLYECSNGRHYNRGNLCPACDSCPPEEYAWLVAKNRNECQTEMETEEEEYRKLICAAEAMKSHLEWVQEQIGESRRLRDRQRDRSNELWHLAGHGDGDGEYRKVTWQDLAARDQEKDRQRQKQLPPPAKRDGYVYLIVAEDGHYKIGRTKDVPSRANTLGVQLPYKIEVVHSVAVSDMVWTEAWLHQMFAEKRANGEWFKLESKDVEFIKSLTAEAVEDQIPF